MLTPKEKADFLIKEEENPLIVAINQRIESVRNNDAKNFQYWSNVIREIENRKER
jgi:hypothetical protein